MQPHKAPQPVDLNKFNLPAEELEIKYGLPREVRFCSKCVISNQRPNSAVEYQHTKDSKKQTINFDEHGVCDACRVNETKIHTVDWKSREEELIELCNRHRKLDGSYDCIVPGSGGKDSFYAAHVLKYKYNMHPLTVTWAPHIHTPWGWNNFQAWLHAGFDNYLCTPNPRTHRLLTRLALENMFHPFQPFILGQKFIAPKMAAMHNVSLIFYGENEAEYGNPGTDTETAIRDWKYFTADDKSHIFLGGTSLESLESDFGVEPVDLKLYMPAVPEELEKVNMEVHYLGYYLKWHPQECYYYSVENGGFQPSPERTPGTYSKYNSIDDKIDDLHFYTYYTKFGIGRAVYDAAQEIRNEEITREEGVALVKKFDGEFPERFAEELFQYLSIPANEFPVASRMFEQPIMDRNYFMTLADQFRSPHLWKREDGAWKLRHTVFD